MCKTLALHAATFVCCTVARVLIAGRRDGHSLPPEVSPTNHVVCAPFGAKTELCLESQGWQAVQSADAILLISNFRGILNGSHLLSLHAVNSPFMSRAFYCDKMGDNKVIYHKPIWSYTYLDTRNLGIYVSCGQTSRSNAAKWSRMNDM